ncbi:TlpA family protein disulfide reductase [Agathobaculum desmolans]|uniref:TlpA family protein disulfide reductase n=1 Tax=Agathobaculum desmolans TaxID=39484 RepID=UPI0004E11F50|nr:TlpA disulfide reductase family protein [Agathobaculum desmolans]
MKVFKKIASGLVALVLITSLAACGCNGTVDSQSAPNGATQENPFPEFTGTDFEGNNVDSTLFSNNEVTLLNFWFNGCSACVNEMPALEELNEKLREKGAELVGVNVEAGESEELLSEAKEILAKQGATYRNLFINGGDEAQDYVGKIFAFPTTIMVDKNGNIIGEPITGSIEDEKKMDAILKLVEDIKNGKEVATALPSEDTVDDKVAALSKEQNNIFLEHQELWDKVFENIEKNASEQLPDCTYAEFLTLQIENCKDLFTEEELQTLKKDLERIDEIDKKIQGLREK